MGLFSSKASRQLGTGVWRRANDRFNRSLDRYHQVLDGVTEDALYNELVVIGNSLVATAADVHAVCVEAQKAAPSDSYEIPPHLGDVHRMLSKASNTLATTAQAAAMARLAAARNTGGGAAPTVELESTRRHASHVRQEVKSAQDYLAALPER